MHHFTHHKSTPPDTAHSREKRKESCWRDDAGGSSHRRGCKGFTAGQSEHPMLSRSPRWGPPRCAGGAWLPPWGGGER